MAAAVENSAVVFMTKGTLARPKNSWRPQHGNPLTGGAERVTVTYVHK